MSVSFPLPSSKISQATTVARDQKVLVASYGDGYEQRAAVGINNLTQTWSVQLNNLSLADRNTFLAFWNAHGRVQSFDWTPPNGSAGKYVFAEPINESNNGIWYNFSMTLKQVMS